MDGLSIIIILQICSHYSSLNLLWSSYFFRYTDIESRSMAFKGSNDGNSTIPLTSNQKQGISKFIMERVPKLNTQSHLWFH